MDMLTPQDYTSVIDILAALHVPQCREDLARAVIPELAKLLASDITSYSVVNPVSREVTGFIEPDQYDLAMLASSLEKFIHEHPVIVHHQANGNGEALRISDFITQRELHDTGLYQELYRPLGVEYQISIILPARKPIIAALVFNRKFRDFSERDRQVLNILRPHLSAAFDAAQVTSRLQKNLHRHQGVLENLPDGIVVLNGSCRVAYWTEKARFWLGKYFPGPARKAGVLPEELSAWLRLQQPTGDTIEAPAPLLHKRIGNDQLGVRLVHSKSLERMLILSEARAEHSARPLESLGLTPRQAEVLLCLAHGCTNEHIGQRLHISVRTVHKHLESIFKILKVNSRTAACRAAHDRLRMMIAALTILATGLMSALSQNC